MPAPAMVFASSAFPGVLATVDWSIATVVAIALAGLSAGAINAVIGSGSLITFPTLVGVGFEKLTANITNNTGLVPGSVSAVHGYRRELVGQGEHLRRLVPMTVIGASCGAALLLALPSRVFDRVVPFLVLLGVILVAVAPRVQTRTRRRRGQHTPGSTVPNASVPWWLMAAVAATGVYGGYFGAGQGVILTGVLGIGIDDDLRRINALKNALALTANATALAVFLGWRASAIDWPAAAVIAVSSTIGAQLGAGVGRRIPQPVLRSLIVVVGLVVSVRLFLR